MQRNRFFLACFFFICVHCRAQQYPFIYYTPNNGLINSRVKSIKQDSKGFMYFITRGGLSIYDGARFTNYSQQNGLANEIVNDIAEITPDSFLIATNVSSLNTLVKGRIGNFKTADNFYPVINRFFKNKEGNWYVAADEGLFIFDGKRFDQVHLFNKQNTEIGLNINQVSQWKNFLLLTTWSSLIKEKLIVYDLQQKKVTAIETHHNVLSTTVNSQGQIWATTDQGAREIDTISFKKGILKFVSPDLKIQAITKPYLQNVVFDNENNLWLFSKDSIYKLSPEGSEYQMVISKKGLNTTNLSDIFIDREGITWFAIDGNGIAKMTNSGVEMINALNGFPALITSIFQQRDSTWVYNSNNNSIYCISKKNILAFPLPKSLTRVENIIINKEKIYLTNQNRIVSVSGKNNPRSYYRPELIFSAGNITLGKALLDPYGNIIIVAVKDESEFFLYVVNNKKVIDIYPISIIVDQMAVDASGRLWIITRNDQLLVFTLHPKDPSNYLHLLNDFSKEMSGLGLRSLTIDKNNNIWIGTRYLGAYYLNIKNLQINSIRQFSTKNGLTDNFIYSLTCDSLGNIWAGTQTGLDKIYLKNGRFIISNVSRNNNFFQSVKQITVAPDNTVLALLAEGSLLKIAAGVTKQSDSVPHLLIVNMKVNGENQNESSHQFSYRQNNFSFSVAAPSFIDEKSIRYSYLLEGSINNNWSEPSNQSDFNIINLSPGSYNLKVKCMFPGELYSSQVISYPFVINPPWWQTLWFRFAMGALILGLLLSVVRYYYQKKLEKQNLLLEKQRVIEKERSRIAADLHDDLGAGLTRIKFITENIGEKIQSGEPVETDLEKLKASSLKLVESIAEIIWAMNEKNNLISDTLYYLRSHAVNYCEEHNLGCTFEISHEFTDRIVSGNIRRNLFLILKECLHNIVKHARAKNVVIKISVGEKLELTVKDDGHGFNATTTKDRGNGIINMKKRVREMRGNIKLENINGTVITVQLPLSTNQSSID